MILKTGYPYAVSSLNPSLNYVPQKVENVYLMGICGTGMAALAGMLKSKGCNVTGSDENVYPPMSNFLSKMNIDVKKGYNADNIPSDTDVIIVGNVITAVNEEALKLSRLEMPYLSFPQAMMSLIFCEDRRIVVAGTHGKTTTTSMAAWLFAYAGLEPGFMVGGIPINFDSGFRIGKGSVSVIEGDEYDTAFFDKRPKFLHYKPHILILTGIEFDHADIYRDLSHVKESFRKLIKSMPNDGIIIACGDDDVVMQEITHSPCQVITYGLEHNCMKRAGHIHMDSDGTAFSLGEGAVIIKSPIYGKHNLTNVMAICALSDVFAISENVLKGAMESFKGVKRRQEIIYKKDGILVMDDFAHHPTAVKATIDAIRVHFKNKKILAAFEPRSNSSRRNVFQEYYSTVFDNADMVFIPEPIFNGKEPERFSSLQLVDDLNFRGIKAFYSTSTDEMKKKIIGEITDESIVLCMSNGNFGGLPYLIVDALQERA